MSATSRIFLPIPCSIILLVGMQTQHMRQLAILNCEGQGNALGNCSAKARRNRFLALQLPYQHLITYLRLTHQRKTVILLKPLLFLGL